MGGGGHYTTPTPPPPPPIYNLKSALQSDQKQHVKICLVLHIPLRNVIIVEYSGVSEDGRKHTRVHYRMLNNIG